MRATTLNHVSICAANLEESTRFYEQFFGLKRIPTPRFEQPTQWLQLGSIQLHLFERREQEPPIYQHLGVDVDDFVAFHAEAERLRVKDERTFGFDMRELPDGAVQMYVRDPAGNLIEIDCPAAASLPPALRDRIVRLADQVPQPVEAGGATLYSRP